MSGRTTWLVCYDIADPKRLHKVHRIVSSFGLRVQFSVYRCALTESLKERLRGELTGIMDLTEDQVLFIALGPTGGRQVNMEHLGLGPPEENSGGSTIL